MKRISFNQNGFTIVELLVAIVVIAILASVTATAYSGVQQRGRDTQRVSDMNAIVKALEMYKIQTGNFPATNTTNTIGGWEASSKNPAQFLSALKSIDVAPSIIPVDPVNDAIVSTGFMYKYYRYGAGANGCDASRGNYYVLVVTKVESVSDQLDSSPGFQCPGRDWSTEGGWVTGAFSK